MAMPLRQLLLVVLVVVASLGLVHAEDFPEGSVVRAAEPTEHDKNNPLFKVSTVVGWAQERVGGKRTPAWHQCCRKADSNQSNYRKGTTYEGRLALLRLSWPLK